MKIPGCVQAPPHLTPSVEWQHKQVSSFSIVRRKLARSKSLLQRETRFQLPDMNDERGWLTFCFGSTLQVPNLRQRGKLEENNGSQDGMLPLVRVISTMNQPTVEKVLSYHIGWLHGKKQITTQQGRWLYALMAALELPLTPDLCFLLRTLARECASLRGLLSEGDAQVDMVAALNLLICIVALYFRQGDLADT